MRSGKIMIKTAIIILVGVVVLVAWESASAGPISNPGGSPYVKAAIYQGVLSIVPGETGDSIMEIGNAGREIKSTGHLGFFPGASSNVYVVSGKLCFGAVGSVTNCYDQSNLGGGPGVTPALDAVLAQGNKSNSTIVLGQGTGVGTGVAYIDVAESAVTPKDAISGKITTANNSKSAIYGQNASSTGWAGYFSGRVNISGSLDVNARPITQTCFMTPDRSIPISPAPSGSSWVKSQAYWRATGSPVVTGPYGCTKMIPPTRCDQSRWTSTIPPSLEVCTYTHDWTWPSCGGGAGCPDSTYYCTAAARYVDSDATYLYYCRDS